MNTQNAYPRNMEGYGRKIPDTNWPGRARIAVQFVLNYEEGAEQSVLDGDEYSETFLSDIVGAQPFPDRHMSMESLYEYGSRAGVWRILAEFERRQIPLTVFGVALALKRNPEVVPALTDLGHEIACHGLRWLSYQSVAESEERAHIRQAIEIHTELTGQAPAGWYTGRDSPNTRRLLVEEGGFEYDSDYYGDDLPFWTQVEISDGRSRNHLVVPYTLDNNDMRFAMAQGFNTGDHFYSYLKDAFDVLYAEGAEKPKMMSIGLHCRLIGRPGRFRGLQRFLDHIERHDRVWVTRRMDIARHWVSHHPFQPENSQ